MLFIDCLGGCALVFCSYVFFFKQKTAYELRISDWSSDVCPSDLIRVRQGQGAAVDVGQRVDVGAGAGRVEQVDAVEHGVVDEVRRLRQQLEIGRATCRE